MTEIHVRISEIVKDDFQHTISGLGYRSMSEAVRDMIEIIAYNGERTPKELFLSRQLLRLKDSLVSPEKAETLRTDFLEFLKEYNYLIYFARVDAAHLIDSLELDDMKSLFYQRFVHFTGYGITPLEAKQLIKHMYHDSDALAAIHNLVSEQQIMSAKLTPIDELLSNTEKLALARGER